MATQDDIDALSTEVSAATDTIVTEIDNLEAQVASGQAPDLTALRAAADRLKGVADAAPPAA